MGYLAYVVNMRVEKKKSVSNVPIVSEFPDVFPKEFPDMHPKRKVEFGIDLIPGAAPIAKAPYHLAPLKMHELSS